MYKVTYDLLVYVMIFDRGLPHKGSNQGHITFKWLYLIVGASYDQSLYEIHIVSHISQNH